MIEFLVIFSVATAGSLVRLSADLGLKFVARKTDSETIATGPGGVESAASGQHVDPVLAFGFVLACYGAIALTLVFMLPGALALERTALAFALLCVGGLVSEISCTGTTTQLPNLDADEDAAPPRKPISVRLSVALTFMLNLTLAVLSSGQGLIEIAPQKAGSASHTQELDPIIVIAQRSHDFDHHTAPF
ncbi:MAG TPA: hypothetical protein VNR70_12915 [Steroidobacteraceae bacterium]|nr:hypothetical protein [Steroidobacteraceae bacterium]